MIAFYMWFTLRSALNHNNHLNCFDRLIITLRKGVSKISLASTAGIIRNKLHLSNIILTKPTKACHPLPRLPLLHLPPPPTSADSSSSWTSSRPPNSSATKARRSTPPPRVEWSRLWSSSFLPFSSPAWASKQSTNRSLLLRVRSSTRSTPHS